ncbi:hypothetical protein MMC22_003884 [Lobaria immixta]|nr:hypothetical protein [Lobaria immixta]
MIYLLFLQLVTTFLSSKLTHNRDVYGVHDIKWYRRISYNPPTPPPQVYFPTSADYADDYYLWSMSNITITKQSPFLVNLFLSFSPTSFTALRRYHRGLSRPLSRDSIQPSTLRNCRCTTTGRKPSDNNRGRTACWREEFELLDGNADIYFCDPSRCQPQSSAAADDLAPRVQSSTKCNPLTKDAIIIRMHSVTTKKEAVAVTARRAGTSSEPVNAENRVGEVELLDIALMIYYAFSMAQEHPHGLKDRRSKLPELSIAT